MKKLSLFFVAISLILISSVSYSANYYVCDSTGSDDNDGLSEATAFKTYDKAIWKFNSLGAGEELLFCRGGEFIATNTARLYNKQCTAENPCKITDYGDESLPAPKIVNTAKTYIFNFENGGKAKQDGGYIVENLSLISTSGSGVGIRLYNDVDDVILQKLHIQGFALGVYSAGSNATDDPNSNRMNDRLVLRDSTIIKNSTQGFLGGCNDCLIENNHFENNGHDKSLDHNIYLTSKGQHAQGITVRGNTLYRSAIVDGICQGVSLVGHGLLKDVLIENNTIKEDAGKVSLGCWGISLDTGYGKSEESFINVTIRNNVLINLGGNAIGCASCDGLVIENNQIIDEAGTLTAGIRVPVRAEDTVKSKDVHIKNNKIVNNLANSRGIYIEGKHLYSVTQNQIWHREDTRNDCIEKSGANIDTDISSNTCTAHNGVELKTLIMPPQNVEEVIEEIPDDASEEVVPVSSDNLVNENIESITKSVTDSTNSRYSNTGIRVGSDTAVSDNQDALGAASNIKSTTTANTSSSSTSSGSVSRSNSLSTTSDNNRLTSDVTRNNIGVTSSISTASEIIEPSDIDASETIIVPSTSSGTESSIRSVTINEVINATQESNEGIDPATCRAYARGKCLMR
ncbi:hypothetical protein [Methylophaga sp.]|uniref:hypothetical protein n=1 Tax=Methylophaga sp. TaxID=2024840 RepID=UPI003A94B057